jgi:aspartate/methionine/tyrosine aminotransferase
LRSAARLGPQFLSTSSLTKSYGLAGLRCGWTLSPPKLAATIRRARDVVDGTGAYPAERLAALAFSHLDRLLDRARRLLTVNLTLVRAFLRSRPELDFIDPAGGTVVFPRVRGVASSDALVRWLLEGEDTAIVPGHFFEAPAHFRLGVGAPTDALEGGLAAIGRALDQERHRSPG